MRAQHGRKIAKIKLTPVAITFGAVESKIFYEVGERRRTWRRERGGGEKDRERKSLKRGERVQNSTVRFCYFLLFLFHFTRFPGTRVAEQSIARIIGASFSKQTDAFQKGWNATKHRRDFVTLSPFDGRPALLL